MKWVIIILLAIGLFIGGYGVGQLTFEPQVIETIKEVPTEVEIIKEVPVEVVREKLVTTIYIPVEKVVTKYVEVPGELKYFESVGELDAWLDTIPFYMASFANCDCDDFARWMQEDAERDGYRISTEMVIKSGSIKHMLNSAIIGNKFYLIEPQTHKVTFNTFLD